MTLRSGAAAVIMLVLFTTVALAAETSAGDQQKQADLINNKGIATENSGDYDGAMRAFLEALAHSTSPQSTAIIKQNLAVSLSLVGNSAYERGDYAGAVRFFKQALDLPLAPADQATVRYNIGQSYYHQAAEAHGRLDLAEELDALNAALEYDPGGPGQSWVARVNQQIIARREAAAAVEHALPFEPRPAEQVVQVPRPAPEPMPVLKDTQPITLLPQAEPVAPPPQPVAPLRRELPPEHFANRLPPTPHIAWPGGTWHGVWWPPADYQHPYPKFRPTLPTGTAAYPWKGGFYYYYNNIYYTYRPADAGYYVTDPPPVAERQTSLPGLGHADFRITARNRQTEQQITLDRLECNQWAVSHSGVNPTISTSHADLARYRRASEACLNGKGYSVE